MAKLTKSEALAKLLSVDVSEVDEDGDVFTVDGSEYMVLTDSEADEKAREYITESLWAFKASFIAAHAGDALATVEAEKALEEMQGKLCESANSIVRALIKDFDHFVKDAVLSDGRGHFLSSYDGEEQEAGEFFVYQTN